MAEVLESAASNYKALEEQHFKSLNTMKEAKEQARVEAAKRAQMEGEMAEIREKVRKLEFECIQAIGKAQEEGKEVVMGEVKTQFQLVYNSGFRHGWKSALNQTEVPKTSDLFLRANTPLPYPETGLKDPEDEAGDEGDDDDEEEGEEEQGEPDKQPESSQSELIDKVVDAPEITRSSWFCSAFVDKFILVVFVFFAFKLFVAKLPTFRILNLNSSFTVSYLTLNFIFIVLIALINLTSFRVISKQIMHTM